MNGKITDVIVVGLESSHTLHGIIVIDVDHHLITGCDNPLFARNESSTTKRKITNLNTLDHRFGLVVPNRDVTRIESGKDPWFTRMEIYMFHTIRTRREFALNI